MSRVGFNDKPSLLSSLKDEYPEFNMPEPDKDGKYTCYFCGSILSNRRIYLQHLRSNRKCLKLRKNAKIPIWSESTVNCKDCGKTFSTNQSLLIHKATCKGGPESFRRVKIYEESSTQPESEVSSSSSGRDQSSEQKKVVLSV